MIDIFSVFSRQVHYPNNLADGLKSGIIYHGVSKCFMTCLSSFTNPAVIFILERNGRTIEENRFKYLSCLEKKAVPVARLDDFILLSESKKSYWVFGTICGEPTGSVGCISKTAITFAELVASVQNNIRRIRKSASPNGLTGEYMVTAVRNKTFNFDR